MIVSRRPQPPRAAPGPAGVVIQARIGSTRLPGKVLLDLGGQTVLSRVIERCRAVDGIAVVCCAVPEGTADDPVATEAERCGARVVRGSEHDVLDRFRLAAEICGLEVVLRITADCPLLDPAVCNGILRLQRVTGADYVANDMKLSWPRGLDCEAVTARWLRRAAAEASETADREHVTRYIRRHPEVHWEHLPYLGKCHRHIRFTLDSEDDLRDLRRIVAALPAGRAGWRYPEVLRIIAGDPSLSGRCAGRGPCDGLWTVPGV
jgi:spore coat polysaccharide biosynthesis protein SpsF (cytidylyltransferase family)